MFLQIPHNVLGEMEVAPLDFGIWKAFFGCFYGGQFVIKVDLFRTKSWLIQFQLAEDGAVRRKLFVCGQNKN